MLKHFVFFPAWTWTTMSGRKRSDDLDICVLVMRKKIKPGLAAAPAAYFLLLGGFQKCCLIELKRQLHAVVGRLQCCTTTLCKKGNDFSFRNNGTLYSDRFFSLMTFTTNFWHSEKTASSNSISAFWYFGLQIQYPVFGFRRVQQNAFHDHRNDRSGFLFEHYILDTPSTIQFCQQTELVSFLRGVFRGQKM